MDRDMQPQFAMQFAPADSTTQQRWWHSVDATQRAVRSQDIVPIVRTDVGLATRYWLKLLEPARYYGAHDYVRKWSDGPWHLGV